jgi:FkbM family methyltransferase
VSRVRAHGARLIEASGLGRAWRNASYKRLQRRLAGPRLLRAFGAAYPRAAFVEIGSNDGEKHDHLRPLILAREWHGVMVEPVPYVFERLRRNYGAIDRVALANVAIADRDGELPFFHLREAAPAERDSLPDWYDGIGSFSRDAVLSHVDHIPDIEARLVASTLPCLTFGTLCDRHGVETVDLLLVDTEGYDWELLRMIDLEAVRPRLVIYEHFHLRPEDRADALARFAALGYETLEEGFDTFCLDPLDDQLTRSWRRLRPAVGGVSAHDRP